MFLLVFLINLSLAWGFFIVLHEILMYIKPLRRMIGEDIDHFETRCLTARMMIAPLAIALACLATQEMM